MSHAQRQAILTLGASGGVIDTGRHPGTAYTALGRIGAVQIRWLPKRGQYRVRITDLGLTLLAGVRAEGGVQ